MEANQTLIAQPAITEKRNLVLYRYSLLLAAILYPGWSIIIVVFLPDVFDILWQRFALGGLSLVLLSVTFISPLAKKHIGIILYSMLILIITHFFYLTYISGNSAIYVIGCMIVASVIALVVFRIIPYIIIGIYSLACVFVITFLTDGQYEYFVMLISGLLTILIVLVKSNRTH